MSITELLERTKAFYEKRLSASLFLCLISAERGSDTLAYNAASAFIENELGVEGLDEWEGEHSEALAALDRAIGIARECENAV